MAKTAAQAAAEKAQPEVKTAAQAAAEKAQPGVKTAAGEKGVPRCFAAAAPDAIRLSSSSGGIFRVLADRVLSRKEPYTEPPGEKTPCLWNTSG